MSYPSIRFHTGKDVSFGWRESCTALSAEMLQALLLESRLIVTTIETELRRRNQEPHQNSKLDICRRNLQKTANAIRVRKRLGERGVEQAKSLHGLFTGEQSDRFLKTYREFLEDVARQCGPESALLCHIGLGKHRVTNLKSEDRVNLLQILKDEYRSLSSDELKCLAESYHVRQLMESRPRSLPLIPQKRAWEETQIAAIPPVAGEREYCLFSFMRRSKIVELPEPFRSGMARSSLWKKEEERGGLAVTNCLSMYLPETALRGWVRDLEHIWSRRP
ncbi:hypothetical protein AFUB_071100 [Aspergillus fumigatus A1163]|uniref:Uncharacterized protein n=1 Tax=Aspergillus fumigatus (strain CBS 144.89 / FGSC A1163 / CEA10) TaxID=451804 RepID=B0Y520_ASPFC|nr:hypothetical protein AFUB_071100 [Aspergillus fumigatus A1163]